MMGLQCVGGKDNNSQHSRNLSQHTESAVRSGASVEGEPELAENRPSMCNKQIPKPAIPIA